MLTSVTDDVQASLILRKCIQKVATGPEYSKDLSVEEAQAAMALALTGRADPVQLGVFLIALRMKRETNEENIGVLRALRATCVQVQAPVDEVFDVADPYDGFARGLPVSPFLPALLAACGVPAICHGLESVGPKYGTTTRQVLRAAGADVDLSPERAAARLADQGWAYLDQRAFHPALHDLVGLRERIVKRTCLTTLEVLLGPVRGKKRTHLLTGFVHKAYPPVYASMAREAGFDTALIVRGAEGGVIPSLQQPAAVHYYHDAGPQQLMKASAIQLGIHRDTRAVPLPPDLPLAARPGDEIANAVDSHAAAAAAAEVGLAALGGAEGPARDSLVYAGALCLHHLRRHESLPAAADAVRKVLDTGSALTRFRS
ncbi:anthranilate phosphoribosyltransferase [Ectothiorhodospiraceae bacterium 2226]|nr:anthranilate phosphoribosyltransferase [Ectothiorhodospiraceae bacterium 2226]